jgi:DNA transposition AAA+ family ATPase
MTELRAAASAATSLAPSSTAFLVTKEYRRFAEFCDAVRRYRYIGLCYGPPGVGKTLSARRYADWDHLEQAFAHELDDDQPRFPRVADCRSIVYTPTVAVTPGALDRTIHGLRCHLTWAVEDARSPAGADIVTRMKPELTELILVDEADRLKTTALEQLRDLYDRERFGLVLIGMPGLEKRLARYPQLYSRIGFAHAYRPLSAEELWFILEHHWQQVGFTLSSSDFADVEAVAAITRITGGNFRLVQRLFTQIERLLEINHLRAVTKEVVEAARESLVIGVWTG